MREIEWVTIDKSEWGDGPWSQGEPDKAQWEDNATGLACLLKRNIRMGFLCGYVGVPPDHPLYGVSYDGVDTDLHDVHGGLTYSALCQEGEECETICHIPDPGEPEPLWWFGFDTGHCFDFLPGIRDRAFSETFGGGAEYRDVVYIKEECAKLATQIAAAEEHRKAD